MSQQYLFHPKDPKFTAKGSYFHEQEFSPLATRTTRRPRRKWFTSTLVERAKKKRSADRKGGRHLAFFLLSLSLLLALSSIAPAYAINGLPAAEDVGAPLFPQLSSMPWEYDLEQVFHNGVAVYQKDFGQPTLIYTPGEYIAANEPWTEHFINVLIAPPSGYIVFKKQSATPSTGLPYNFRYTVTCNADGSTVPCYMARFAGPKWFDTYLETHSASQCATQTWGATACTNKYKYLGSSALSNNYTITFDDESPYLSPSIVNVLTTKNIGLDFTWDVNTNYIATIVSADPKGQCQTWDISCHISRIWEGVTDTFKSVGKAIVDAIAAFFMPDGDAIQAHFDNVKTVFEQQLGFLAYPFTFFVDLFSSSASGSCSTSSCVRNYGNIFGTPFNYDFAVVPREFPVVFSIVQNLVRGLLSLGLITVLYRKIMNVLDGDDKDV